MKSFNFKYIHSIAAENITAFKDIFKNPRLRKSLWFEFIINPEIIKKNKKYLGEPSVNAQLKKALSWYTSFRWLFKKNPALEGLINERIMAPYIIRGKRYKKERRSFLKGITYAGLC